MPRSRKQSSFGSGEVPRSNKKGAKPKDRIARLAGEAKVSEEVTEEGEENNLEAVFVDEEGKAERRRAKAADYRRKRKEDRKSSLPVAFIPTRWRSDNEPLDDELYQWGPRTYLDEFVHHLPKDLTVADISDTHADQYFKFLVKEFMTRGASPRGLLRCLFYMAKNIRAIGKQLSLPVQPLSIRRFVAYRSSLFDMCKGRHLPEGTTDWFLASDSPDPRDFNVEVTLVGSMVMLEITDPETGKSDQFHYRPDDISKHVMNQHVLEKVRQLQEDNE